MSPSKVILSGEHSVVYDKLGIATSVDLYSSASIKNNDIFSIKSGNEIASYELPDIENFGKMIDKFKTNKQYSEIKDISKNDFFSPMKYIIYLMNEKYDIDGFCVNIESDIPIASGMGSGSSVFCSMIKSISDKYNLNLDKKEINELCYQGDVVAHGGLPSGIDNSTVTYGGYLKFRKSTGIENMNIDFNLPIVIGSTGIKSNTSELVCSVRDLLQKDPDNDIMNQIEKTTKNMIDSIYDEDLEKIGNYMNENQDLLRKINVSHPRLEELIQAANEAGAYGSKLSGAGGGGIMISLCENPKDVSKAIEDTGGTSYIVKTGVKGVERC